MRGLVALAVIVGVLAFVAAYVTRLAAFGRGRHLDTCGERD